MADDFDDAEPPLSEADLLSDGETLVEGEPLLDVDAPALPSEMVVPADAAGQRLDVFMARAFPTYSRVKLRLYITKGLVVVLGKGAGGKAPRPKGAKPSFVLHGGELLRIALPPLEREIPRAEDIPLSILYEDEHLVAVNKPPHMVVHPARGHWSGTLTSALQFHFDQLSSIAGPARPGIVHRLDRDTSGVILVAKTDRMHSGLGILFQERDMQKEYFAIVTGRIDRDSDLVDLPIGIHPYQRERMAVRHDHPTSREAQTVYHVQERFNGFTAVHVLPKTGRTHQIRVHLDAVGHPILCDRQYGGRGQLTWGDLLRDPADARLLLNRQALHAWRISFAHPVTGEQLKIEAPLPADIQATLAALRTTRPER